MTSSSLMPCHVLFDTFSSFWWAETESWVRVRYICWENEVESDHTTHPSALLIAAFLCGWSARVHKGSFPQPGHCQRKSLATTRVLGSSTAINSGHLEVTKKPSLLISTNFHAQQDTGAFYSDKQSLPGSHTFTSNCSLNLNHGMHHTERPVSKKSGCSIRSLPIDFSYIVSLKLHKGSHYNKKEIGHRGGGA